MLGSADCAFCARRRRTRTSNVSQTSRRLDRSRGSKSGSIAASAFADAYPQRGQSRRRGRKDTSIERCHCHIPLAPRFLAAGHTGGQSCDTGGAASCIRERLRALREAGQEAGGSASQTSHLMSNTIPLHQCPSGKGRSHAANQGRVGFRPGGRTFDDWLAAPRVAIGVALVSLTMFGLCSEPELAAPDQPANLYRRGMTSCLASEKGAG